MANAGAGVSPRDRWLVGCWIVLIAVAVSGVSNDTDPYWQIRAGLETLDGAPLTRPESWSWAPVDGLFYPNSPGWNVVLALAWRSATWWGLYAVTVAVVSLTLSLTAYLSYQLGARTVHVVAVLLATTAATFPILSPRAVLPAQALFLLSVCFAWWWANSAPGRPAVVNGLGAGLFAMGFSAAGNWIHLSWATLALSATLAWAAIFLLHPGPRHSGRAAMVAATVAGMLAGVLIGPYGPDVLDRTRVVLASSRDLFTEWLSPFNPLLGPRWWPLAVLVFVVTVSLAVWTLRSLKRGTPGPRGALASALLIVTVPYAVGGLLFVRFVPVAALMLAPLVAAALTVAVDKAHHRVSPAKEGAGPLQRRLPEWTSDRFWRVILWSLLVVLSPLGLLRGSPHTEPTTLAANDQLPPGCQLFSGSIESAAVILTRPDVPIWIDGRADYWGRARIAEAHDYLYAGTQPTLVPPGTTCVLLSHVSSDPGLATLTAELDADPAWVRLPDAGGAHVWLPAEPSVP